MLAVSLPFDGPLFEAGPYHVRMAKMSANTVQQICQLKGEATPVYCTAIWVVLVDLYNAAAQILLISLL